MQLLFVVLIALGCISTISALQCYSCTSLDAAGCNDPFNSNGIQTTTVPDGGICDKSKVTGVGALLTRGAATDASACPAGANGCKTTDAGGGITAYDCCCTTDLCNGVSTLQQQPVKIFFLTIATLAAFIYRFY